MRKRADNPTGAIFEAWARARKRPPKYGNHRVKLDGISFASGREAGRYQQLKALEGAGFIARLELQPRFPLYAHGPDVHMSRTQIGAYVADFRYLDELGRTVIEDAKGFRTELYKWKKKHVEAQYGIVITEV